MSSHSKGLRLIFAGTPEFAAHHLQALIDSPHEIVAVYTQPDRPAGRGKKLTPSPVKKLAVQHDLPVYQPQTLKEAETQEVLKSHQADVMVVVAYGLLLPKAVLDIPSHGCLNVHGSILPRWRGAAPIQRAVLGDEQSGDKVSGITIMQMDVGLDTGDMLYKSEYTLKPDETSASLHDELMKLGAPALLATLEQLQAGKLVPEKQDDALANYAEKISKEEAKINWSQSAQMIERSIRAYNPFPVAYSFLGDKRIKFYKAEVVLGDTVDNKLGEVLAFNEKGLMLACGENKLLVKQLQLPGKKAMPAADLLNGYADVFSVGSCFE
jgi:methionyl-tRNA formyltransferase